VNGIGRMICSMCRPTAAEAINRRTPRAKGVANRAKKPLGRSDWADRPRPFLGRFGPVSPRLLLARFLICVHLHVGL
jgi:hypothetical protein